MEKYVTVVSVDDQPASSSSPAVEKGESDHHQRQLPNVDIKEVSAGGVPTSAVDSQFVTVVSISHGAVGMEELEPEVVLVYRLPGERLGFGLKFQGGTKNNEKIQRLFIQSCAENSPASRVQASWGYLREGDEILEIDEVSVTRMTRIECVKCLKESNLAIKLLVRNGEGKVQNFYDENGDVPDRKSVPPPPPPVPPRKLNKRKSVDLAVSHDPPVKQLVEIVHPPDAEVYSNLFSDDISDLISESDDTASTISTVIDKYSICSSLSSEDYTISSNPSSLELAKALKPFTLLEKEFNLESKLENNLFTFQPASVNVVQLEVEAEPLSNDYENVSINKIEENKNYENIVVHASDHQPQNYENVTIQAVTEPQPYENVTITTSSSGTPEPAVYENVDLKSPPRPLPRQAAAEQKKRAVPVANVVAPPRQKSPRMAPLPPIPPQLPHEFNTIQSWLQEATEVIHECALTANSAEAAKREKSPLRNAGSNENLPRLIDFHPKVSSPFKASPQPTIITIDNVQIENSEPTPEQTVSVKKCIKIIANDANAMSTNYIESSDDDDEEDEDENDEQEEEDEERIYEPAQMEEDRQLRCYAEIAGMGAFDSYSDEDGEKLGPPEIIDGGPSEAYFNYHWTTTLLPPIGEVEEEFSSLENQQSGPIVIIDTAEETLFNDSNNNQHREPKPKLNGHSSGEAHQLGSENSVGKPVLALVPATKIEIFCSTPALQKPSSDSPARSSNRAFPGAGDGHSKQSDVIGAVDDTVEQETAGGDMRRKQSSSDTADKSQVQPNTVEVPTAATAIATSELNRTERDAEMRLDQLMNDLVDDNENSSTQSIVVTMEVDSTPEEVSVPQVEAKNESDRDVDQESNNTQEFCDEDMGLLVAVGDSVDSDFEELVKAQLDGDNSVNSEQIQQIHERIIVGIERSSTSGDSGSEVEVDSAVPKIDELRTGDCVNDDAKQTTPMDVPDCGLDRDAADADEQPTRNYQESGSSSPAALTPTAGVPTGSNSSSATTLDDEPTGSPTATIMDQMNNVVTTTTTATAIASTVYQQTTPVATSAGFLHKLAAAPPAFSRLPPDGHEFPPNFSEPSSNGSGVAATTMTVLNGNSAIPLGAKGDKHSSYDDIPDLPKSHPPAVPRKVFRQDLVLKQLDQNQPAEPQIFKKPPIFPSPVRSNSLVADSSPNGTGKVPTNGDETRRRSFDIHEINKPPSRVTLVGSNWRKDEKSERSVRDKIAMFSHGSGNGGGGAENEAPQSLRKFSKDFTKSSENLLGAGEGGYSRKSVDPIETYATLRKKAHSVENLDEVDSIPTGAEFKASESNGYKTKFSLETSKPVVLGKAYSVENLNPSNGIKSSGEESNKLESAGLFGSAKILSRTTSFSGYSNGNSLASISNTNNVEERRKSSITSLLEQRKKSMSKLRGLVIPEKVPETEVLQDSKIIGLPIIKSKDSEKIFSSNVLNKIPENSYGRKTATLPTPVKATGSIFNTMAAPKPPSEVGGTYKSIFRNLNGSSPKMEPKAEFDEQGLRRPLGLVPPAKPPRTSLTYPPTKGLDQRSQTTEDESDDSDSVLSSRVSTPPVSPVAPSPPEKYVLTRTLSSETNTSIASSNSTLTSSSGSQASCSSVGSTPAIDMSRRISKSSSSEMSMNRKNVLASAKSRSGRGDLKIEDATNGKAKRYEDGDSTDGYEEEERRKSKSKPRGSVGSVKSASNGFEEKEITHYKVVDAVDSIVDKVIKVASYVEVVSDVEENAGLETEVVIPMQKPVEPAREKNSFSKSNPVSTESGSANTMSDLAKWVRHEAAKTINSKESEAPARVDVKKFTRTISEQTTKISEELKPAVKRELRSSVDTKKLNLAEIRKSFEAKSNNSTVVPSPVRTAPKENHGPATGKTQPVTNNHDRFSSWDSLASSSSGVSSLQANSLLSNAVANCTGSSQTLQSTPSDYGSFSSLGSSHSLITPQDLQLIIEEADPPLATPEAFVIVLQRETPESSIGITLAGGSDYEAKEITIHKILNNSPAEKDGRLRRGDRILSINGLSMRGLTHRESLSVLKTPRPEVVMVITRSKSLIADNSLLAKIKRPSLGSLSSLAEKNEIPDYERKIKIQHKASRSLDLDLDIASNEAESVFDGTASEDGLLSADESKCSSITPASDEIVAPIIDGRLVEIIKDGAGLGFSIEGGFDSPAGNKPLLIKKIFMGGAAEKSGLLKAGEEIVAINDIVIERMTRIQVWNMMKKLPNGVVKITLK